jgi:Tol biopolymer transport system component
MNNPALSPDGRWLAFTRAAASSVDLWLRDLTRGAEQRFATTPRWRNGMAQWSPKGDRLVFMSDRSGTNNLYLGELGASGDELVVENKFPKLPTQWSRDGKYIVYTQTDPKTKRDIWILPMEGSKPGTPFPFLQSEYNELYGQLSPDSHWMAYASDESGEQQVYVRPFPNGPGQWNVSVTGGEQPRWSADGRELFFIAANGKMAAVAIKPGGIFNAGPPVELFDANLARPANEPIIEYDIAAGGKRFVMVTPAANSTPATLNLVTNWAAALNR